MSLVRQKRIGVALGSGGAKGMAHLGALQALEEAGITFDIYAGTSAGSIVGAMRARGYTCEDIEQLLARLDYRSSLFSVLTSGTSRPVLDLLNSVLGECDFSELKKPFAAVATDALTGEEVVLREGNIAEAVLASCSIPPLFRGVNRNGQTLIDGAFTNAIPGDRARELGADFVIGIALSPAEKYRINEFMTLGGERKLICQTGFDGCDILLEPDLAQYSAADMLSGARMYEIGYDCVKERLEEIRQKMRSEKIRI